jgi:hypothetical protein
MVNRQGGRSQRVSYSDWSGGLNNVNDLSTMADNELAILDNLEVDSNGYLTARPPIVKIGDSPEGAKVEILGFYTDGGSSLIVCAVTGEGTYLYDPALDTWTLITEIVGSGCAQYNDELFICSLSTSGGFWDGSTFTVLDSAYYAADGAYKKMPKGSQITLHKERLFMVSNETGKTPGGRIFFSRVNDLVNLTEIYDWNVWAKPGDDLLDGNDFFDVSPGDGQEITAIISGSDEIFIFRERSTYYFKYAVDILTDSALQQIDAGVGADNKHCVIKYEFGYLVLNNGKFYRFVSYLFYPLNDQGKLEIRPAQSGGIDIYSSVSTLGRRAIIFYGGQIYAIDLESGVWSTWSSEFEPGYFKLAPRAQGDLSGDTAYGILSVTGSDYGILRIRESLNAVDAEEMVHTMQTRAHDLGEPGSWKRMYYWSVDIYTRNDIVGTATPIQAISSVPSWDSLELSTWDDLEDGTWDLPSEPNADVVTSVAYTGVTPYRVNATFQKDMRFRRCAFKVRTTSDGTTGQGPVRISTVIVHASLKQSLPQIIQ